MRSRKQRVPQKMNSNKSAPKCIIIKMAKIKDKERILKATRQKQLVTYKGTPIRLSVEFSVETLQARREWHVKVLKEKTNKQTNKPYNQEYSTQQGYHSELKER